MQQIGDRLQMARSSYDEAMSKLAEGKGNVIRQAEQLCALGRHLELPLEPHLAAAHYFYARVLRNDGMQAEVSTPLAARSWARPVRRGSAMPME